ncbi:MFS transporter [Aeromonas hydrophila]|uniref:MFS transporter n=1 Tax=Aeromonas hydrophila TaxID=644 RepID=UPI000332A8E5|nr:MFS transporter [Aeromonas hydrophila]AGM45577.1 MFS family transporter [Aeromonas hydrophila ML09-119]AHX34196.1 major facilitator transporter [Aeromonas hydrophila subsp. hydrophila AL09-71]AHX70997.1 major facilitator transporter [Aeromonas hydrophila pc104A]AJE35023.1 major facilitator transporter [Aeromonas hydrophila J-1]AKJ33219.1 major facilitator transporter [Aeromonas hydrophila NJ-35]
MEGIKGQASLWVLVMTVTLAVAGFSLPSPVLAPLLLDPAQGMLTPEASDWSRKVWLGVIMGLYPLFQLVGAPWLGKLSDRHGRKPVLTLCLVGVLVGYALMALGIAWRSLPLLLLSRVVEGFFNGDIAIVQAMAADMSTAKTKARSFAWINIGMNLGWVVGPMIGGYAAVVSGDYSLAAWLAVAMTLVNLLLVLWLLPNRPAAARSEQPPPALSSRQLLLQPALLPYFVLTLLSYGAVQLYFTYFNVWLVERLAWDPVQLAQAAVLVSVPMILGSWLGSRLARHWRGSSLGVVGHLVMAAGMLMFVLPGHWWGLALTFIPTGIGMSLGELATSVAVSNRSHAEQQGQAMGLYRGLAVGSEILAVVVGSLVLLAGTEWPFYLAALCSLLCAIGFYGLRRAADRRQRLDVQVEAG